MIIKSTYFALGALALAVAIGAAHAQDGNADWQAAAWKAIVDQIEAIDPNEHARQQFGALLFGYPGDRPPPDRRQLLCLHVMNEGTKGRVPVEQIARASRLCAR